MLAHTGKDSQQRCDIHEKPGYDCRRSLSRLPAITGLVVPAAAAAPASSHNAHGQTVPCIPTVRGPIGTSSSSRPYIPTSVQGSWPVAPKYVVQEFFVSCNALAHSWEARILIRRPKSPAQFSGTVVTEVPDGSIWTNSYYAAQYEMSAGIVSAMVESVPSYLDDFVKPSNPGRYAALHIPDVTGINYVIEAEVGALLKSGARDHVLPGLHVKHVIFSGFSGSAAEVRGSSRRS